MASVWKHPESKFWIARFGDARGKTVNRTTRQADRKAAQKVADAYEAAARKLRSSRQVRDVIAELHRDFTGKDLPMETFKRFSETWLKGKVSEVSEGTHDFYSGAIGKFSAFVGDKVDEDMNDLRPEDISGFRDFELNEKGLAAKTVNHDLKCLRMVFRAARIARVIGDDPCELVKLAKEKVNPAEKKAKRRPFKLSEIRAVLKVADPEWKSMVTIGYYTAGQRLKDIALLSRDKINLASQMIRIRTSKTGKQIHIPISAPLLPFLKKALRGVAPDAPLHPRAHAIVLAQGKTGHLSNQFADLLAKAGLREKKAHRKDGDGTRGKGSGSGSLSFHCLRHTAVSTLKEAGIPQAAVMELVGHDSEEMSQHYTHVGEEALRKAAAAMPKL